MRATAITMSTDRERPLKMENREEGIRIDRAVGAARGEHHGRWGLKEKPRGDPYTGKRALVAGVEEFDLNALRALGVADQPDADCKIIPLGERIVPFLSQKVETQSRRHIGSGIAEERAQPDDPVDGHKAENRRLPLRLKELELDAETGIQSFRVGGRHLRVQRETDAIFHGAPRVEPATNPDAMVSRDGRRWLSRSRRFSRRWLSNRSGWWRRGRLGNQRRWLRHRFLLDRRGLLGRWGLVDLFPQR